MKERANALNIPYQTLMKQYISNGGEGGRDSMPEVDSWEMATFYWKSASRTNSLMVRCSFLASLAARASIAGGKVIERVLVVRME